MLLRVGPGTRDSLGTSSLRGFKKLTAKNRGDLQSAIVSGAYYARKFDRNTCVYMGNSFGRVVWRVSQDPQEYLDPINNTGTSVAVVSPDLTLRWHEVVAH